MTFETNDNYLIRFEISDNSWTIRFDSKWKTLRAALVHFVYFLLVFMMLRVSAPVQLIAWKNLSLQWPVISLNHTCIMLNGWCTVEGQVEEAIRTAFLKLDDDMTHGVYVLMHVKKT